MASMRDELVKGISASVEVVVEECEDGTRVVRGLDGATCEKIASATLAFLSKCPIEGFAMENHVAGLYRHDNISALIEDIEDDD